MKTKMIALVTAGAIAISGISATTAQANPNQDLFNFIAGAAFLAIVAQGINNSQPTTTRRHNHGSRQQPVVQRHRPPQNCLRQRNTAHGWKKFYAHRCLEKVGYYGQHRHW